MAPGFFSFYDREPYLLSPKPRYPSFVDTKLSGYHITFDMDPGFADTGGFLLDQITHPVESLDHRVGKEGPVGMAIPLVLR